MSGIENNKNEKGIISDMSPGLDMESEENLKEKLLEEKSEPEIAPERIDINALWVVRRLRAKGFEAYLTGGCVRDLLLNKTPKDFDVATSARPEEVKSIFRNCRLIGRRFLLAHVMFPGGKIIETATFRAKPAEETSEEESEDLLVMQDNVYGTIEDDAFRRDLTVNGLFYDPVSGKVIDYVGGRADLAAGLIRTIGDPSVRMQEDPVRILRAIRFATRLGFKIEEKTLEAMKNFADSIVRCAPARLQEEVVRLLTNGHAKECFRLSYEIGILKVLMPELLDGMGLLDEDADSNNMSLPLDAQEKNLAYWYRILEALDQIHEHDCYTSSSVAFTSLLLPAYSRLEQSSINERNWIDRLCVNWAERIRLTRRDQDLIRLLLSAIPLFHLDKIHQKSAQYLVRKPWFKEALLVYILYLIANEKSLEEIGVWKLMAQEADRPYRQDKIGAKPPQARFRKRRAPPLRGQRRFRRPGMASE
jgi:poly(A) polymerase